jgi:hypothetical protein
VLDGVLLRPLPYPDVARLVVVRERSIAAAGFNVISVSWPDFVDWRAENRVFEHFAVFRPMNVNLTGSGDAERPNARSPVGPVYDDGDCAACGSWIRSR